VTHFGEIERGIPIPPIVEDLVGQRFGRLLVIARAENKVFPSGRTMPQWLVRCDCGREKIVLGLSLRCGATRSCSRSCSALYGELTGQRRRANVPDIVGQRFTRLVVMSQDGGWCQVHCDCGTEETVPCRELLSGETDSCGCLEQERLEERQRAKVMQHKAKVMT
jgi:hypothetical protein